MCAVTWDVRQRVEKCWVESFDGLILKLTHIVRMYYVSGLRSILWLLIHYKHAERKR